jgi:hypothetical protein
MGKWPAIASSVLNGLRGPGSYGVDDPAFGALTRAACDEALRWLGEVADG